MREKIIRKKEKKKKTKRIIKFLPGDMQLLLLACSCSQLQKSKHSFSLSHRASPHLWYNNSVHNLLHPIQSSLSRVLFLARRHHRQFTITKKLKPFHFFSIELHKHIHTCKKNGEQGHVAAKIYTKREQEQKFPFTIPFLRTKKTIVRKKTCPCCGCWCDHIRDIMRAVMNFFS